MQTDTLTATLTILISFAINCFFVSVLREVVVTVVISSSSSSSGGNSKSSR